MRNAIVTGFKKALSLSAALFLILCGFVAMKESFEVSALNIPWDCIELEVEDEVIVSIGINSEAVVKFTPKYTGTYTLESSCIDDTMVTIYNENQEPLASDDNGKDEENFRLTTTLTGGNTYYYGIKYIETNRYGLCRINMSCSWTDCEHPDGVYSAGKAVSCHSDGFAPGWWCKDCERWYHGHERIDGGHINEEGYDEICDRCGEQTPMKTGEIGPSERPYLVKYQIYPDGSMDIFGTSYIDNSAISKDSFLRKYLTSVEIYEGVEYIDESAFYDCTNLVTVKLPESITSIRMNAFSGCTNLVSINIPSQVSFIGVDGFSYCHALKSIALPDAMTGIGVDAFRNCTSLETVNLGNGITTVEETAFKGCTSLKQIDVGDNVTLIKTGAFEGCTSLNDVQISKNLYSIGGSAFKGCSALENIVLKGSLQQIGVNAFENCTSLSSVFLTSRLTQIGNHAFNGCSSLTDVYYAGTSKAGLSVGTYNNPLTYATWHYNQCVGKTTHAYDNACDAECNDCGALREVGDHQYSYDCDTTCNICGATRTASKHTFSSICDTTCEYCNYTRIVLYHYYSADCDTDCDVCGLVRVALPHSHDNACDTTCNVCNATRPITHNYKTTTTKATTSKNGKIVKQCTVCDNIASTTTVYYAKSFSLSTTSYTYNGSTKTPTVTVKDYKGNKLKKDTDYTVTYPSSRKNAGTYTVTVKGKGNYSFTKTLTFKINPISYSKCSFKLSTTSYTYNGNTKKPTVTVKNASGTKLTEGTHYTVSYASGRKNVGTYKVTVKMKGNYSGTKTLTFKINPKAASVNKLTAKSKALSVKLNTQKSQATGYQIRYSTSKSFKSYKTATITSYKTSTKTISSLKAKTTYYVRVRTYKTVNGVKYYSGWSSAKSMKTK